MSRHPLLDRLATIACMPGVRDVCVRPALRYFTHSSASLKRRQQAYNLLAAKASAGVSAAETQVQLPNDLGHVTVCLNLNEDLDRKWYFWGYLGYEPEGVQAICRLIDQRHYSTIIEVGANIGLYSLLMAAAAQKHSPSAVVFTFEPFATVYEALQRNIRRNPKLSVKAHQMAVCETTGQVTLHIPEDPRAKTNASLVKGLFRQAGAVDVPSITLDAFADSQKLSKVDFVKLDCEGAEPSVLAGAKAIIHRDSPDILIEVLPECERQLQQFFEGQDYRFYHVTPQGLIAKPQIIADATNRDYFLSKRAS